MRRLEERISEHSTEQLRSMISNVTEVLLAWGPAWQLLLSAKLLWYVLSVRSAHGRFVLIVIEVSYYRQESAARDGWFSFWYDHRLGTYWGEQEPNDDLSPGMWTRMIVNL